MKKELVKFIEMLKGYKEMYRPLPVTFDESRASEYIKKYGVGYTEYKEEWKYYHEAVFHLDRFLPEMVFRKNFEFISFLGGSLFDPVEFRQLTYCLRNMGEENFIVMDDLFREKPELEENTLIMNYPTSISWEEISNGDYVSIAVLEATISDYFLFSKSGKWGMYSAPNYINAELEPSGTPLRILGFDPEYRDLFREVFNLEEGEYCVKIRYEEFIYEELELNNGEYSLISMEELREWVPLAYR